MSSENESANLSNHSDTEVALISTRNQPRTTPIHTVWTSDDEQSQEKPQPDDEDPTTPIVPDRGPNKEK